MIEKITVTYTDGNMKFFNRATTKWLLIAKSKTDNVMSLSGDDMNDSYLLRLLENAVIQTIDKNNKYLEKRGL